MLEPYQLLDPELSQFILEHFPTPLASAYQRLLQAETWHDRSYRALALFDYGIRSLTLIYVRQYLLQDSTKGFNHQGLNQALSKFNQPTLGAWLEILFTALDAYKEQRELHPFPELHDAYEDQEQGRAFRRACQEIVQIRNGVVHRFVPDTEEEWKDVSDKLFLHLQTVLNLFKFIQKYSLVDVTETHPDGAVGVEYKGIRPRSITLPPDSASLQTDRLYFWAQTKQGNRYYDIYPLMISWPPDNESQDATFYESLTNTRISYLATLLRHTVDTTEKPVIEQLTAALDTIRLRRRESRRTASQLAWGLWKEITSDITQMETEAIRAKYDPKVYLQRIAAKSMVDNFLTSESTALLLLGKSGVGKSNFLLSLLEDYINKQDVAILMLDAARLPIQNQLDFTLARMIREVASLPDDLINTLEKDLWGEINKITTNKQFILIFDAINENDKARELLAQIDRLIGGAKRPWLKIIISSRPQAWQIIQRGLHLAEHRYFRLAQHTELGFELDGFTLTEQGAELKDFTVGELPEVYAKYREVWNLQTEYTDLPPELKRRLRDPLTLKLIAEIYENQTIPPHIDPSDLYARYVERLIKDNRLEPQDVILLEQDFMPLMISENHYSNEITAEQVAETNLTGGRPLRDLIFDTTQLELSSRVNSPFTRLTDTEILVKQGGDLDFAIRFKYERFYDYYAGKTLVHVAEKSDIDLVSYYLNLIDNLNKHPYLWGAIQQGLAQEAKAEKTSLLINLAKNEKQITRDIVFNTIVDLKKSRAELASYVVQKMFNDGTLNLIKLAVQVSGAIGETEILEKAGHSKLPAIRALAVQSTYYLWQSDSKSGWEVLNRWGDHIYNRLGLPNIKFLQSVLSLSMLIITDPQNSNSKNKIDYQNPLILSELQRIWVRIIDRLFSIRQSKGILKNSKILWINLILTALIKFALTVTTSASLITSRERGSVIPLMKSYFRYPPNQRQILGKLADEHIDARTGIEPLETLLLQAFQKSEPLPVALGLSLIAMRSNTNDPKQDINILNRLFKQLFDPQKPSLASAQLVFTAGGILQRAKANVDPETWKTYTDMERNYLDAGGCYYLPNQPKYEAGYIDVYTCTEAQKLNATEPTLFPEYVERVLNGQPAPSISGLLGEADSLAIVEGYPQLALDALRPIIQSKNKIALDLAIKIFARIRLYHPDLLENFLYENNAPAELIMKVQTTVVQEDLWADFLISRIGGFMTELLFVSPTKKLYLSIFRNAETARSLEEWLLKSMKLMINFIYGSDIF